MIGRCQSDRRRIIHRSGTPRSNTTPDLSRESFSMADNIGDDTTGPRTHGAGLSNLPFSLETFPTITDSAAYRYSPAASIRSASSTTTDIKKKYRKFSFKFKDSGHSKSSHGSPHQLSPLPPLTPVKAAQVLGINGGQFRSRSQSFGSQNRVGSEFDDLLVRSTSQQASPSLLNTSKQDRKSTRLNSSHSGESRMPASA